MTPAIRALLGSSTYRPQNLILPMFVREGAESPKEIPSMPGVFQHSLTSFIQYAERAQSFGIQAIAIFGVPMHKDARGSEASNPNGITQVAIRVLKDRFGDSLLAIPDLCLDEFSDHGHCGILGQNGEVDNDKTLDRYREIAISLANSGADIVAPSGMMDGQVGAIRQVLDDEGYTDCGILAYSAKYASCLYGPFRDAVEVSIQGGGDRKSYQQDIFRDKREALLEAKLDVDEGADFVMVKPAGTNLDVIAHLRENIDVPICAYQVSGEYSMIAAASAKGWLDRNSLIKESLHSIFRSGADMAITYFALEIAEELYG